MGALSLALFSDPKLRALPCSDKVPPGVSDQYPAPFGVAATQPPVGTNKGEATGKTGSFTTGTGVVTGTGGTVTGGAVGATMKTTVAAFTVNVKACVACGRTPFAAVIVRS